MTRKRNTRGLAPPNSSRRANPQGSRRARRRNKPASAQANAIDKTNHVVLSPATRLFASAIFDPFGHYEKQLALPGVPDFITMPSFKFSNLLKGTFTAGANGVACVSVFPHDIFTGTQLADAILCTTTGLSAFTDSLDPRILKGTPSTAHYWANAPVTRPLYDNEQIQMRVVSVGLIVEDTGAELTRAGLYSASCSEDGENFDSSAREIAARASATVTPIRAQPLTLIWRPRSIDDIGYKRKNTGNSSVDGCEMMVMATGCEPNRPFQFKLVVFAEMTGNSENLTGARTRTDADMVGLDAVFEAASTRARTRPINLTQVMGDVATNVQKATHTTTQIVETAARWAPLAAGVMTALGGAAAYASKVPF